MYVVLRRKSSSRWSLCLTEITLFWTDFFLLGLTKLIHFKFEPEWSSTAWKYIESKNKLILDIFHRTLSVTGRIKCVKKAKSEDDIALIAGITLDI